MVMIYIQKPIKNIVIISEMQIPVSDADFYQRKIIRLEKDIANLNDELNVARARLRSAEDFQIKYQLLLRQSQQENLRAKKAEEIERAQLTQMMTIEIEQINMEWKQRLIQLEQQIRGQQKEEKAQLQGKVEELERKNKEMSQKSEQMDVLLFKNKKIAKDLESLQEIIEENRISNEKQREEDLKNCKQGLTKKFLDKMKADKENYDEIIKNLEQRYEKLQIELMKAQLTATNATAQPPRSEIGQNRLEQQLESLKSLLKAKDEEIERTHNQKIADEERHHNEIKYLKKYQKDLEEQIFTLQSNHQVEIINFKERMEEVRAQEIKQKQKQCEIIQKQHMKDVQLFNEKILKQKAELQSIRKAEEAEIAKLKDDKERLLRKIAELKDRLKDFESNQQNGETKNMLQSLKNIDKKEDELNSYEDGVTFLERQLKKTTIKLEKKNAEVKELVTKMNNLSQEFEKELSETKDKFNEEKAQQAEKIEYLEEQLRQLNEQIRKKDKETREVEADYIKKLNQINAENRSLINMNNDLQRDYNRILESKKVIEKSFREERERSITSKSQIAVAKKQKWLQLQRQKNQIQIIYKQKEEQLKTNYEILLGDLRTQLDKVKREKELTEQQLSILKDKIKSGEPRAADDKENVYSEYHKKLATVNLQIALTQNLYNTLLKAKSRVKRPAENEKEPQPEPIKKEMDLQSLKKAQFEAHLNKIEEKDYKSFERSIKQIQKISENESREVRDSGQFNKDEHPMAFDDSEDQGGVSPTFKMLHSFNPARHS